MRKLASASTGSVEQTMAQVLTNFFRSKRLLLILAFIACVAIYFWSQSRVPALNEKAEMGDELQLQDSLGFDVIVLVEPGAHVVKKIVYTTINWSYTNWKGMAFGLLMGASLMVLFSLLTTRAFTNAFANSGMGVLVGAPLGVCVNCATPIAQGAYYAGARLEFTLATLMSSPTLNVIVLTMLFSLFPIYMVVIKLGLTIPFILIGIPLVVRWFGAKEAVACEASCPAGLSVPDYDLGESWGKAVAWTGTSLVKNLGWVLWRTAPLMLLAGLMGSVVIHLIPWETLVNLFEGRGGRLYDWFGDFGVAVIGLTIVASVGIVLPVPMTFDIIIVATLLGVGMPVHYAMALLFTLGIFSLYPFTIIWKDMSPKIAVVLAVCLSVLGAVGGVMALEYDRYNKKQLTSVLLDAFSEESRPVVKTTGPRRAATPHGELMASLAATELTGEPFAAPTDLSVTRTSFAPRVGAAGAPLFKKSEGARFGLDEPYRFDIRFMVRPYEFFNPIAAGDVHNDGWMDIALVSAIDGVSLYANTGGRFVRQALELPRLDGLTIGNVALVDLNNDGWLDLYVTTYRHGNFVFYSEGGDFSNERFEELPNVNVDRCLTSMTSFGDLDRDGDLEIALGNWARWNGSPESTNAVLYDEGDSYRLMPLTHEMPGNTWSVLLTDWNVDGHLDLIIGNEGAPSPFYLGDGTGNLAIVNHDRGMIPHTPFRTMTLITGDINNDLVPEIYMGQITGFSTQTERLDKVHPEELCDMLGDEASRAKCQTDTQSYQTIRRSGRARDARRCEDLTDANERDFCFAFHAIQMATWNLDPAFCGYLPERWSDLQMQCEMLFEEKDKFTPEELAEALPQTLATNVLLVSDGKGAYQDLALEFGVTIAGWTWNAQFADVNNDEWIDLYAVNGVFDSRTREAPYLYLNQGGKKFVNATKESGAEDFFPTSAYVYVDMDNDGDLDIVSAPVHGPLWVFQNQSTTGHAIAFELRDLVGNRFGIGSKVVIHYGEDGTKHQVRELLSGGGFLGFNPIVAHFGLGPHDKVQRVEVEWSTGERTEIAGDFSAGATYRISRPQAPRTH